MQPAVLHEHSRRQGRTLQPPRGLELRGDASRPWDSGKRLPPGTRGRRLRPVWAPGLLASRGRAPYLGRFWLLASSFQR